MKREDIAVELEHALIVQSWDTALTANANSDYSAVTHGRVSHDSNFLLNAKQMKVPSDRLVEAMRTHAQAWRTKFVLVRKPTHRDLIRTSRRMFKAPQLFEVFRMATNLKRIDCFGFFTNQRGSGEASQGREKSGSSFAPATPVSLWKA